MKPRKTKTGHADGLFSFVLIFGFNSSCAAANASLKASDDGSSFDIRSQYKILLQRMMMTIIFLFMICRNKSMQDYPDRNH